ncbi:MAG: hypothetical protein AAFW66_11550, partial [Pseudomonadota bacterium]
MIGQSDVRRIVFEAVVDCCSVSSRNARLGPEAGQSSTAEIVNSAHIITNRAHCRALYGDHVVDGY